jgi:hypothetical protein
MALLTLQLQFFLLTYPIINRGAVTILFFIVSAMLVYFLLIALVHSNKKRPKRNLVLFLRDKRTIAVFLLHLALVLVIIMVFLVLSFFSPELFFTLMVICISIEYSIFRINLYMLMY